MENEGFEPREITIENNEPITVWGPFFNHSTQYTHVYQSKETFELDKRLKMDDKKVDFGDPRIEPLNEYIKTCNLGNPNVNSTLMYFLWFAANISGNLVGFRKEEIDREIFKKPDVQKILFPDLSLEYTGNKGPYLTSKQIEGSTVIFPRNLPELVM